MMHIILGLFFIALGIWGVMDEWYYVLDSIKAIGSLGLLGGGLLAFVAGLLGRPSSVSESDDAPELMDQTGGSPERDDRPEA